MVLHLGGGGIGGGLTTTRHKKTSFGTSLRISEAVGFFGMTQAMENGHKTSRLECQKSLQDRFFGNSTKIVSKMYVRFSGGAGVRWKEGDAEGRPKNRR